MSLTAPPPLPDTLPITAFGLLASSFSSYCGCCTRCVQRQPQRNYAAVTPLPPHQVWEALLRPPLPPNDNADGGAGGRTQHWMTFALELHATIIAVKGHEMEAERRLQTGT